LHIAAGEIANISQRANDTRPSEVFMTKYSLAAVIAAVTLSLSSSAAFSQTATGTMGVTMTVAAECTLATDPIAFGPQGLIATAVNITGNITVQCTAGAPYQIALNAGTGVGATIATRLMTGTAHGQLASYTIHQGTAAGVVWGITPGTDTLDSAAATGNAEVLPFVAVLNAAQSVQADDYTDTVTATISYGTAL
jgi:spore coat protein U-like protein